MLQERGPLPGPENGLLSNTQKWIVPGDTCADKAKYFIGRRPWVESSRIREPRRSALPCGWACSPRFYGNGISFQVVSGQSSCLGHIWSDSESFLMAWAFLSQMDSNKDSGRLVISSLFFPLPILLVNLQGSTMFLSRASWWKTAHESSYYHAWPRWAVSVNGPLIEMYVFIVFNVWSVAFLFGFLKH